MSDLPPSITEMIERSEPIAPPPAPADADPQEGSLAPAPDGDGGYDDGGTPPAGGFDPLDPVLLACAEEPQNDIGNSRRFRRRFGDLAPAGIDVRHVQNMGWFGFDGTRWREDVDGQAVRPLAHQTVEAIGLEALVIGPTPREAEAIEAAEEADARISEIGQEINQLDDEDISAKERKRKQRELRAEQVRQKEIVSRGGMALKAINQRRSTRRRFANASGNSGKLDGMLKEAVSWLSATVGDFDQEELALNILNGTLRMVRREVEDLENPDPDSTRMLVQWHAETRMHAREDMISKLAPVFWCPEAASPVFDAFVARILPDPEVRAFVQRFMGYAMTRWTSEQAFCIFYGEGRNGKSTLIDIVAKILGDYAATIPIASLVTENNRKGAEATPDLVKLIGARFLRSAEPKEGLPLDEALIKDLTGGEPVNVRRLNQEFVEVYPEFKLVISCNRKPVIRGNDEGIWRRVILVPFEVQIPKEEIDKKLKDKLWGERTGILNWLLAGLQDYLVRGALEPPEAVRAATQEYRDDSDIVGAFVRTALDVTQQPHDIVEAGQLYAAYTIYARKSALTPVAPNTFNRRMPKTATQYGFEKAKSSLSQYIGIRIKSDFDPSRTHFDDPRG